MNEPLEKAVRYVSGEILKKNGRDLVKLIEEACEKFDLSPADSQILIDIHLKKK